MAEAGRMHGFAGYFDTVLFGDTTLSKWVSRARERERERQRERERERERERQRERERDRERETVSASSIALTRRHPSGHALARHVQLVPHLLSSYGTLSL
jgi:hypothetical protein